MRFLLLFAAFFLFAPFTNAAGQTNAWPGQLASSTSGNVYAGSASLILTAPVKSDYTAGAGSVVLAAPIGGDALVFGGSVLSRAQIAGDFRAIAGTLSIAQPIAGDLAALAVSVQDTAPVAGGILVAGNEVALAGAGGPVTIYGNTVTLSGTYDRDVYVLSSAHLSLASSTVIHGSLTYEAPERALIPDTARIDGGVIHRGSTIFPNADASRLIGFASMAVFMLARILGALILAGLLAGLFPRLGVALSRRAHGAAPRTILLTMLLGFAALAATPILLVLLTLTFVGIGIALLMLLGYALLILLALAYAGILVGAAIARRFRKRETVLWHDGVVGMLLLSLATLVPFVGLVLAGLLTFYAAGALLLLFFRAAFPADSGTDPLLY
jgi:hypothetical protein